MANIEQNICDAIEVIANNIVSKAGFDKTIQATIISCVDEATGKYKVKYQDNTFYAYSSNVETKYGKGNRVYILIPGNDMTRDKTILGAVGKSNEYVSTEGGEVYEKISDNLITYQGYHYDIYSGTDYNFNINDTRTAPYERYAKIIYEAEVNSYDIILQDNNIIADYIKDCGYIYLGANFKTNFSTTVTKGNYGIKVLLRCNTTLDDEETYLYPVFLDLEHGITGEYYNLFNKQYNYFVFPKPDNFIRIERIEIFAKDFIEQLDDNHIDENYPSIEELYDIEISDIEIFAANSIKEIVGDSGIYFTYPRGRVITTYDDDNIPVQAKVMDQGKLLEGKANDFYWFKKDLSVNNINNSKYCNKGGLGWECLNTKDEGGKWQPATDTFTFNSEYLLSHITEFKVVSSRIVGNSEIRHEKEFKLYNNLKNLTLSIVAEPATNPIPRSVEDLKLTCELSEYNNNNYKFYWSANTNNLTWIIENTIKRQFNCEFLNKTRESYSNFKQIIKNIHLNTLNASNNFVIFSCTVKEVVNDIEYTIGTAQINLVLANALQKAYTLEIVGGNQIFQYDENGDAPTKNGNYIPEPLTLKLTDNLEGRVVDLEDAISKGRATIQWIYPENPTMLKTGDEYLDGGIEVNNDSNNRQYTILKYILVSPYNKNNINSNQIGVKVVYNDREFEQRTNFTFLTQGDAGTNGTLYSARIIPIVGSEFDIPRWITFTTNGETRTGVFNFGHIDNEHKYYIDSQGCHDGETICFPFKAQLIAGGNIVFDDYKDAIDPTNGSPIEIKWSLETKRYDSRNYDRSNFSITEQIENDPSSITLKYNNILYTNSSADSKFIDSDREYNPANILKCEITYTPNIIEDVESKKFIIYASIPIVTIINNDANNYLLDFDVNSGYSEVVYNRDACLPRYDSINKNFKINFNSLNINTSFDENFCEWLIKGYTELEKNNSNNYIYVKANNLSIDENNNSNGLERIIEPLYKFNGSSVTNAILFKYQTSYIHIPIDMHLNRYGLAMLNQWDGTSIDINKDGGYILAPQIGAGNKDDQNGFTGVIMGQAKDEPQRDLLTGLYGYYQGERTFGLMADNGVAVFGKQGQAQIVIDPKSNHGFIYSDNFFNKDSRLNIIDEKTGLIKSDILNGLWNGPYSIYNKDRHDLFKRPDEEYGHGMIIDFTAGHIYFGSGRFHVDPEGNLTLTEGHFSNSEIGWSETPRDKAENENYFIDLKNTDINDQEVNQFFLYCRPQGIRYDQPLFSVKKDGSLYSTKGQIGGFYINTSNITSNQDISNPFDNNRNSVITLSTIGFTRNKMNVVTGYDSQNIIINDDWDDVVSVDNENDIVVSEDDVVTTDVVSVDIIDIVLEKIELRSNIELNNLVMAIGDDFAVTEDGILYARNSYIQKGMFNSIATQNAYIKEYLDVTGDAHFNANISIEKNLEIKGTTYTKNIDTDGNITLTGELTADGNITGEDITGDKINCTEICINDNMTIHGSSIMLDHSEDDILVSNNTPEMTMNCEVIFWDGNDILVGSREERLPWMSYGTNDLTPGVDNLPEGHIYLVYEPA